MVIQQKKILDLLSDGRFHSGEELGQQLDKTRSAVWKAVKQLEKMGLEVHSVRGRGYRIPDGIELLDEALIRSFLPATTLSALSGIQITDKVDSTNTQAINAIKSGVAPRTVFLAETQTAGRGRNRHQWVSPYGHNIYLSLVWQFNSDAASLSGLSLAVGILIARVLKNYGIPGVGLKWPNDVMYRAKKLGGILIEFQGDLTGPCDVVIGMGLNLCLPREVIYKMDQPCTDIRSIIDKRPDRNRLIAMILQECFTVLPQFEKNGLTDFLQEWHALDILQQRNVSVTHNNNTISGIASGIDVKGRLRIQTPQEILSFTSGQVRY